MELRERLQTIRDALLTGLVERDIPVRLALLAALAGEHLLLIGPPGTAKSLLARRLQLAFNAGGYFERLLTRFSVPEELFGPLSIKELENDRYQRQIDGYLPSASVAFLDEIFKANSAILNSLLTLLNEREFDNGNVRIKTPLICVIGASNELPEQGELDALYDRFLLRMHVDPVSEDGFRQLLALAPDPNVNVPDEIRLTEADLQGIRDSASKIRIQPAVERLLRDLRLYLQQQNIQVSDRRWLKIVKLLRVSAFTNGRDEVSIWDAWLLQHCTWAEPEQRETIADWYQTHLDISAGQQPERLRRLVRVVEDELQRDQKDTGPQRDVEGRELYQGRGDDILTPDGVQYDEYDKNFRLMVHSV